MVTYIVFIVLVALLFDFANGFNDAANSVATIVATRVLSPRLAVLWAAFFNFIAAFFFHTQVAATIGKGLVESSIVDPHMILATLLSAITWTFLCTRVGLPISVSHALIGSLAGAALMKGGLESLKWGKVGEIAIFIVASPIIGLMVAYVLMVISLWVARNRTPRNVDRVSRVLQLISAAAYSLSHGLNDAQKTMGIIMLLLLSHASLSQYALQTGSTDEPAWWIILTCHAAIAMGTYLGGWKVIRTLGHRVTKLQPIHGFCAETGGAFTIIAMSYFGIPVSTTHTITGSIFGVGLTRPLSSIRWSVGIDIMTAWVLTLPVSAAVAAIVYYVLSRAIAMFS